MLLNDAALENERVKDGLVRDTLTKSLADRGVYVNVFASGVARDTYDVVFKGKHVDDGTVDKTNDAIREVERVHPQATIKIMF